MDQYAQHIFDRLTREKSRLRPKYQLAVEKYEMWEAYYRRVLGIAEGKPNIVSMAYTQKLLAYTGIAESLFPKRMRPHEKVDEFFGGLDAYSKLLFMMTVRYGADERQCRNREARILNAYTNKRRTQFDNYFKDIISLRRDRDRNRGIALFNLRSRLVHHGEFIFSAVESGTNEIVLLASPSFSLAINEQHMSLDEAFLRGICAKAKFHVPAPTARVDQLLRLRGIPTQR